MNPTLLHWEPSRCLPPPPTHTHMAPVNPLLHTVNHCFCSQRTQHTWVCTVGHEAIRVGAGV
jgi:hypothetical protein